MTPGLEFYSLVSRQKFSCWWQGNKLGKARLLGGNVAPLLDNRLLDLPGVGP